MKTFIAKLLATLARYKINQHQPIIIGVTGSVGKTTTKQAIAIVLAAKYQVRTAKKNYNNEFGLPLAVLGEQSPGKNAWEWLKLLIRAFNANDMPDYLVLEYGVDAPGNMAELIRIARPEVVVLTAISPVHVANYPNLEALVTEKATLGEVVGSSGLVVLNGDDVVVVGLGQRFSAPTKTYSLSHGDAYAENIRFEYPELNNFEVGETFVRLRARLHVGENVTDIVLDNCATTTLLSAALAALLVAVHLGVPMSDATTALSAQLVPANGRMRPLAGIKGSVILDDSYNAAPASMIAGLDALQQFAPRHGSFRRLAVLGDMAELGFMSATEHATVGTRVAQVADVFVAVGVQMRDAMQAAAEAGMPEDKLVWFEDSVEAGRYLDRTIQAGDVVLVKGSQSMRMERIVKAIMAEPARAEELLVRQEAKWLA